VQAVSNVWNEPWEELLSARGIGARQAAPFIGRIRGRLSLKGLGQLQEGFITTPSASPFVASLNASRANALYLKRSRLSKRN
jgi:hypothetical protein